MIVCRPSHSLVVVDEVSVEGDLADIVEHARQERKFRFRLQLLENRTSRKRDADRVPPEFIGIQTRTILVISLLLEHLSGHHQIRNLLEPEERHGQLQ